MKLYGDFSREDWLKALNLSKEQIPASMILHGEWNHEWNLSIWKDILSLDMLLPKWNIVTGTHGRKRIGFANVFGGPMAATIAHQFACAGTDLFIQTGYFGGLSRDLNYGDILIVTGAEMQDGVSHWYLPEKDKVMSDQDLVNKAISYCRKKGYRCVTGTVISTSAMMLETHDMVKGWSEKGHLGVDMETAATLAVAKKYDKQGIALLNLSDHIIEGDTLYNNMDMREDIEEKTDKKIRDLALYLCCSSS